MRTARWLAIAMVVSFLTPAFAGPEMPMYQFPQAKQIPMLPDPSMRPGRAVNAPCTPVSNAQNATTPVAAASSGEQPKYHVVDGKCVVDDGKQAG